MAVAVVARLTIDPATARVFEHSWPSWSPTTTYAATAVPARPVSPAVRTNAWGLDTTRRLLATSPTAPFVAS
jgi:hypothetical protein